MFRYQIKVNDCKVIIGIFDVEETCKMRRKEIEIVNITRQIHHNGSTTGVPTREFCLDYFTSNFLIM